MLPYNGCHPEINVLFIGGYILKTLEQQQSINIELLFKKGSNELKVSTDHLILALDWLYVISAINYKKNEITLNEVK